LHEGVREKIELISETHILIDYILEDGPSFKFFTQKDQLKSMVLHQLTQHDVKGMDLSKKTFKIEAPTTSTKKLKLKFLNVDTDELKDTVITCDGDLA